MNTKRIYQCEDSMEGICSAVYEAWASKYGHDNIELELQGKVGEYNMKLFSEYRIVKTDSLLAEKVTRSIQKKISEHAYQMVFKAAMSADPLKANAIYHFLVRGFALGPKVCNFLSDPYVQKIFELNRKVGNETHYYIEFSRFMELESGGLLAKIEPSGNVIGMITPHFADRLANDNFIILDVKRRIASIHPKHSEFFLTELSPEEANRLVNASVDEEEYENLWRTFFHSIAIRERENYVCQRNHLPLHYRKYMTEFLK